MIMLSTINVFSGPKVVGYLVQGLDFEGYPPRYQVYRLLSDNTGLFQGSMTLQEAETFFKELFD